MSLSIKEEVTSEALEVNVNEIQQPEAILGVMTKPVTKGQVYSVREGDSFWDIAVSNNFTVDELTALNPEINPEKLSIGTEVTLTVEKPPLTVIKKEVLTYEQPIAYDKQTKKTDSMYVDETKIAQKGQDGVLEVAIEVVYENGVEVTRQITNETIKVEAISEIKQVGTKEKPIVIAAVSVPKVTGDVQKLHWDTVSGIWSRNFGTARITDVLTGKSFYVMRTGGTLHADVETATTQDTAVLKTIYGGGFSWTRRPIIVEVNGYKIGASMSGMPHAGVDSEPNRTYVSNRSGGYGSGTNYDGVKGNGMDGHFDVHFYGSKRHNDGQSDPEHQAAIASIFS
jgi:LysM repeat protein